MQEQHLPSKVAHPHHPTTISVLYVILSTQSHVNE